MSYSDVEIDALIAQTLRSADITPQSEQVNELVNAALKAERSPQWVRTTRWAVVSGAALCSFALLFHPSPSVAAPSLEQVDAAVLAKNHYSLTYEVCQDQKAIFTTTEVRDGDLWRVDTRVGGKLSMEIAMDGKSTICNFYYRKPPVSFRDAPVKSPRKLAVLPNAQNFASVPSELFHASTGPVVATQGVRWQGRTVDRFECTSPSKRAVGKDHPFHLRHVLYVDPVSHLPIEMEVGVTEDPHIQERFTYHFDLPTHDTFHLSPPSGAKRVDLMVERRAVRQALTRAGLVIYDRDKKVGVFLPDRPEVLKAAKAKTVRVRIDGWPTSYTWPQTISVDASGAWKPGNEWKQPVIFEGVWSRVGATLSGKHAVRVWILGKPYKLPVKQVADVGVEFDQVGQRM